MAPKDYKSKDSFINEYYRNSDEDYPRLEIRPGIELAYRLKGPEGGRLVVCCCGFSNDSSTFVPIQEALSSEGFRVLIFDYICRGHSTSDTVSYPKCDGPYYVAQVRLVLEALKLEETPMTLLGYSMGGPVATLYTVRYPQFVTSLIYFAPAGLEFAVPWSANLVKWPVVGYALWRAIGQSELRKNFAACGNVLLSEMLEYSIYHVPGFLDSLHSTLVHFPMTRCEAEYREIAKAQRPTFLVWGDGDVIVPFKQCQGRMAAILRKDGSTAEAAAVEGVSGHLTVKIVPDGSHDFVVERSEEVVKLVTEWARSTIPA